MKIIKESLINSITTKNSYREIKRKKRLIKTFFKKPVRFFSFLELIIVLSLVSFLFTFLGIRIFHAIAKHRFYKNMQQMEGAFHFCRRMALTHQCDISLTIGQERNGIRYIIGIEENEGLFCNTSPEKKFLYHLYFTLNGQKKESVQLNFTSSGKVFPLCIFQFFDNFSEKKEISLYSFIF